MSDPLENAILAGAVRALRKRAAVQRAAADGGTLAAGEHHPRVAIRSPEAATAATLANSLASIADWLEAGAAT